MANLSGLLKRRYGKFVNVIPSDDSICAYGKFISQEYREGEAYQVPIQLTNEHGVTFDVTNDAYTLAAARDAVTAQAAINGARILGIPPQSRQHSAHSHHMHDWKSHHQITSSSRFFTQARTFETPGATSNRAYLRMTIRGR